MGQLFLPRDRRRALTLFAYPQSPQQLDSFGAVWDQPALTFYKATHSSVISKWQKAVSSDTLGPYVSPPSTWVSPKAKEQAKKTPKQNEPSTPGGSSKGQSGSGGPPDCRQPGGARGAPGSDANFGMIIAPDSVRNGPQLSSGKHLCLAFAQKGKSCTQGFNCPHQHVSMRTALIPDLQTIEKWVADTPNVSWSTGRPYRLSETPTGGTTYPTSQSWCAPGDTRSSRSWKSRSVNNVIKFT
jgi:hypothetical protein